MREYAYYCQSIKLGKIKDAKVIFQLLDEVAAYNGDKFSIALNAAEPDTNFKHAAMSDDSFVTQDIQLDTRGYDGTNKLKLLLPDMSESLYLKVRSLEFNDGLLVINTVVHQALSPNPEPYLSKRQHMALQVGNVVKYTIKIKLGSYEMVQEDDNE